MVDIAKSIRLAVDTGTVEFGSRSAVTAAHAGNAKLIVLATNCPEEVKNDILDYAKASKVNTLVFEGSAMELGSICGRPHPVAAMCIIDAGTSNILDVLPG